MKHQTEKDNLDAKIDLRLSKQDKFFLASFAKDLQVSVSNFLRHILKEIDLTTIETLSMKKLNLSDLQSKSLEKENVWILINPKKTMIYIANHLIKVPYFEYMPITKFLINEIGPRFCKGVYSDNEDLNEIQKDIFCDIINVACSYSCLIQKYNLCEKNFLLNKDGQGEIWKSQKILISQTMEMEHKRFIQCAKNLLKNMIDESYTHIMSTLYEISVQNDEHYQRRKQLYTSLLFSVLHIMEITKYFPREMNKIGIGVIKTIQNEGYQISSQGFGQDYNFHISGKGYHSFFPKWYSPTRTYKRMRCVPD